METPIGTYRESTADSDVTITCPNGSEVKGAKAPLDMGCDLNHVGAPAYGFSNSSVTLSLRGDPRTPGPLFRCVR
jgi:hypothetical protein